MIKMNQPSFLLTIINIRITLKNGARHSIITDKFPLMAYGLKYTRGQRRGTGFFASNLESKARWLTQYGYLSLSLLLMSNPRLSLIFSRYPALKRLFKGRLMLRSIVCAQPIHYIPTEVQ